MSVCLSRDFHNIYRVTHADKIRGMSDKELAEWGATLPCCPPGPDLVEACYPNNMCENTDFRKKCWLEWLKSPVEKKIRTKTARTQGHSIVFFWRKEAPAQRGR